MGFHVACNFVLFHGRLNLQECFGDPGPLFFCHVSLCPLAGHAHKLYSESPAAAAADGYLLLPYTHNEPRRRRQIGLKAVTGYKMAIETWGSDETKKYNHRNLSHLFDKFCPMPGYSWAILDPVVTVGLGVRSVSLRRVFGLGRVSGVVVLAAEEERRGLRGGREAEAESQREAGTGSVPFPTAD